VLRDEKITSDADLDANTTTYVTGVTEENTSAADTFTKNAKIAGEGESKDPG
jgi:hypothetical protein